MSDFLDEAKFLNEAINLQNQQLQLATNQFKFMEAGIAMARQQAEVVKQDSLNNSIKQARGETVKFLSGFDYTKENALQELAEFTNGIDPNVIGDRNVQTALATARQQVMVHYQERKDRERIQDDNLNTTVNLYAKAYPEMASSLINMRSQVLSGETTHEQAIQQMNIASTGVAIKKVMGLLSSIGTKDGLQESLAQSLGIRTDKTITTNDLFVAATGRGQDDFQKRSVEEQSNLASKLNAFAFNAESQYNNVIESFKATRERQPTTQSIDDKIKAEKVKLMFEKQRRYDDLEQAIKTIPDKGRTHGEGERRVTAKGEFKDRKYSDLVAEQTSLMRDIEKLKADVKGEEGKPDIKDKDLLNEGQGSPATR